MFTERFLVPEGITQVLLPLHKTCHNQLVIIIYITNRLLSQ